MPPHAHGAPVEEEEVIVVRTDGPPFVDLKAKQGRGFEVDFDHVQKYLGPGKLSLAEYSRDIDEINSVYIPTAHKAFVYMQIGAATMMASFVILIVMGIIGGTPGARSAVIPVCITLFVIGVVSSLYSRWIEQAGIREGAAAARQHIDEVINPRYVDSQYRITWTISVHMKPKKTVHMGRQFAERPVISIYALRSPNDAGVMTDWKLPEALAKGIYIDESALRAASKAAEAAGTDINVVGKH